MNNDELSDVYEALEKMRIWKSVYESLLKNCETKQEAIQALKYLMVMEKKLSPDSFSLALLNYRG